MEKYKIEDNDIDDSGYKYRDEDFDDDEDDDNEFEQGVWRKLACLDLCTFPAIKNWKQKQKSKVMKFRYQSKVNLTWPDKKEYLKREKVYVVFI